MSQRHKDADLIWNGGASNRRAVANALARAIKEAEDEGSYKDAAVQMILDQLCFLLYIPQPSLHMEPDEWQRIEKEVEHRKQEVTQ